MYQFQFELNTKEVMVMIIVLKQIRLLKTFLGRLFTKEIRGLHDSTPCGKKKASHSRPGEIFFLVVRPFYRLFILYFYSISPSSPPPPFVFDSVYLQIKVLPISIRFALFAQFTP